MSKYQLDSGGRRNRYITQVVRLLASLPVFLATVIVFAQESAPTEEGMRQFFDTYEKAIEDSDLEAFARHFSKDTIVRETNKQNEKLRVTHEGREAFMEDWKPVFEGGSIQDFIISVIRIEFDPDSGETAVRTLERCEWKYYSRVLANICDYKIDQIDGQLKIIEATNRPVTGETFPSVLTSIPFEDFYISVEIGGSISRPEGLEELRVDVRISRNVNGTNQGEVNFSAGNFSISVNSFGFRAGQRMFPSDDVAAFLKATDAAKEKTVFNEEVETRTFNGMLTTRYETSPREGDWRVRVTRGGESLVFSADEGDNLRAAMREAEVGKAWYRKLLEQTEMPEPTPLARPPVSDDLYANSSVGEVSLGGFSFEVETNSKWQRGGGFVTGCNVKFYGASGYSGSIHGDWIMTMLEESEKAIVAAGNGKKYEAGAAGEWNVKANVETGEADILVIPSESFSDRTPLNGSMDLEKFKAIRQLIEAAEVRREWFEKNEALFLKRPESK